MFAVDERTAEAIRQAYEDGGELAGAVELRRHFPLIADTRRAASPRCLAARWRSARTAQNAAGTHPSRLACRTQQTIPGTGRPMAKNTRPGSKSADTRRGAAGRIGAGMAAMAAPLRGGRVG